MHIHINPLCTGGEDTNTHAHDDTLVVAGADYMYGHVR